MNSKRQRIRNFFLIISFLLFPITHLYFSPFLMIWGASQGIITISFFIFAALFIGALIVGRALCGWVMPCGGIQEIFFSINGHAPKTGRMDYLKYVIWVPLVVSIVILFLLAGGYKRTEYFFHLERGVSMSNLYIYIPYYNVVLLFFLNSVFFGKRATCHYLCCISPSMIIARKISNFLNTPAIRLRAHKEKCVDCKLCDHECPMSLKVSGMVSRGCMENPECILCGRCADICPKKAIAFYFGRKANTVGR